jgi:hypothetical protein
LQKPYSDKILVMSDGQSLDNPLFSGVIDRARAGGGDAGAQRGQCRHQYHYRRPQATKGGMASVEAGS